MEGDGGAGHMNDYFTPSGNRKSKQDKKQKARYTKYKKGGSRRTIEANNNAFKE